MAGRATENLSTSGVGVGYDEAELSRSVIQSLSDTEKEIAARISYRYYLAATLPSSDKPPSIAERDDIAMDLARRFLFVEGGKVDRATTKMKATLKHRDEVLQIDDIRKSFLHSNDDDASPLTVRRDDDQDEGCAEKRVSIIRRKLEQQIEDSNVFVRGYDKDRRPIIRSIVRTHKQWDETYYVVLHEYLMDRALAAAERDGGKYSKVIVIMDFSEYTRKNEAPIPISKNLLFTLRDHYPEFIEHIFMIDAPLLFRFVYTILKPFIDRLTKKKIKFVKRTDADFSEYMSDDEIMFCMGKTVEDINLKNYLHDIPYSCDVDGN